jgi:protein TonB
MAPPAKITEEREPDILPADFGEWDGGPPPTTLPDNFNDFDAAPRQPAPAAAVVLPEPPVSRGGASVHPKFGEPSEPVESKRAKAAEEARRKAEAEADARAEAKAQAEARKQAEADARAEAKAQAEARKQAEADTRAEAKAQAEARKQAEAEAQAEARKQARAEALAEDEEEGNGKSKMWIAAIAAILLLGFGGFYALNRKPAPKPLVAGQTLAQPADSTSLASASKPKPTPTTTATPATTTAPETAVTTDQPSPAPVQSAAMQQQLNAPSVLKGNLKPASDTSAPPPPSGNIDMGSSGATPNVFGSKPAPTVTAAPSNKVISVAASIMTGRAVSRTPPVYPAFARTARVDGTVVLHATISKAGTVQNVSVISGPPMLRQSALDAVKTWRYKPYLLDNEPVEVETTVNVIFVL